MFAAVLNRGAGGVDAEEEEYQADCIAEIRFFPSSDRLQKFFRVPIGFKQRDLEAAYARRLNFMLHDSVQAIGFIGLCFIQLLLIMYLVTRFNYSEPTITDILFLTSWGVATLVGLCRHRLAMLGERGILASFHIFFSMALASHPYRQAWLFGLENHALRHSDSVPLMMMSVVLSATYRLNIRSSRCFILVLSAPSIYLAFTVPLPDDSFEPFIVHRLTVACAIAILSGILFLSHCLHEMMDRIEFVRLQRVQSNLVQEKVLRCTAEHQADAAAPMVTSQRSEDDQVSMAVQSNLSSALFDPCFPNRQLQLQALMKIGRREQWLIRPGQITCSFTQILGKGGYGQVFGGMWSSLPVAIKVATDQFGTDGLGSIARELRMLRQIRHPNVVSFYGACVLSQVEALLLVEELIQGDKLSDVISLQSPGVGRRHQMLVGICSGMGYLHGHRPPIVHADLKPANILVERPLEAIRIVDFGLSVYHTSRYRGRTGTLRWQAPETLTSHMPNTASDIYSFGYLAFYVMTGHLPFLDASRSDIKKLKTTELVNCQGLSWPAPPVAMQTECQALCAHCLPIDPHERVTAVELSQSLSTWPLPHEDEEGDDLSAEEGLLRGLVSIMANPENRENRALVQL
eukprot:TRINITY_DN32196_c0_g1_i1.p1 TRINITY_DN32196_c0_g1~~TRINITY_DN32196_c0_g1_i1.p1  ORF type:complete len:640 (+),score=39.22 TRINITY_DN32196_c0_g1_i1:31-1920(+)